MLQTLVFGLIGNLVNICIETFLKINKTIISFKLQIAKLFRSVLYHYIVNYFRDLNAMSKIVGSDSILIDAVVESSITGGPIGGQTNISLRNEHMSYIITW